MFPLMLAGLGGVAPGTGANGDALLPPAVPDYRADLDAAHKALGQASLYIAQLAATLRERAEEANRLHEELAAANSRITALEAENEALGIAVEETARARLTAIQHEHRPEPDGED